MKDRWAAARWALAMAMLLAAPLTHAQAMYRCSGASGTYLSDRPCPGSSGGTLGAYGPGPERYSPSQSYTPSLPKAAEILPYLSPECAQLNEAIRTGPARGLKGGAMADLATDYRQRCADDEQLARQKLSQVQADERDGRRQAQSQQKAERARATLSTEQCHETLRILAARRKRAATMSAGERGDLELFEANYKSRCTTG